MYLGAVSAARHAVGVVDSAGEKVLDGGGKGRREGDGGFQSGPPHARFKELDRAETDLDVCAVALGGKFVAAAHELGTGDLRLGACIAEGVRIFVAGLLEGYGCGHGYVIRGSGLNTFSKVASR